jgi:hypothetical protein
MAVATEGRGEIGAEPVTAGVALRIDALHGEAGHVLHLFSLSGRKAQIEYDRAATESSKRLSFPSPAKAITEKSPGNF